MGYINVGDSTRGAHLFYWFFEAMNNNASAPVILWLQGGTFSLFFFGFLVCYLFYSTAGPGCSAMMGLFNEVFYYVFFSVSYCYVNLFRMAHIKLQKI